MSISCVKGHAAFGSVSMCVPVAQKATSLGFLSALKDPHLRNREVASVFLDRKRLRNSRQSLDVRVRSFKSDKTSVSKGTKRSPFVEPKGVCLRASGASRVWGYPGGIRPSPGCILPYIACFFRLIAAIYRCWGEGVLGGF